MFKALRGAFRSGKEVAFNGSFKITEDPLIPDKERVKMMIREIWNVGGYRFTYVAVPEQRVPTNGSSCPKRVRDHPKMKTGHKTRLWCSQDNGKMQKQRKSKEEGVKLRDHVGMKRYSCRSRLVVTSRAADITGQRIVSIRIQHHEKHPQYYDVEMPPEALEIIRANLEWSTPVSMVSRVQALFPNVTAKQIHAAWTRMSEVLWRRDKDQLKSAGLLLDELGDDVDVFEIEVAEGVEQVCWAMKKIAGRLKGKIVEIAIDATCQCLVLINILPG